MKTRMTIKQQIIKAVDMSNKKKHTEDCIDANDDTSVFAGECICPKSNPPHTSNERSEFTPGPFTVDMIAHATDEMARTGKPNERAMYIVRAVNAHEELLELLKESVDNYENQKPNLTKRIAEAIQRAEKGD